jgi:twinkle protein
VSTTSEQETLSERHAAYLERRGICLEVATALGLFSADVQYVEREGEDRDVLVTPTANPESSPHLALPYEYDNKRLRCQVRDCRPNPRRKHTWGKKLSTIAFDAYGLEDPTPSHIPLNAADIDAAHAEKAPLIIVEGDMDLLTVKTVGAGYCCSIPGASFAKALSPWAEKLRALPKIILAIDDDEPGDKLYDDIVQVIGDAANVAFVEYPQGCKDLNDVLRQEGAAIVKDVVAHAQYEPLEGQGTIDQVPRAKPYNEKDLRAFGPEFARLFSICDTHLSVVTGLPSSGKTTFLKAWIFALQVAFNVKTSVAMFEEDYERDTLEDFNAILANIKDSRDRHSLSGSEYEERAKEWTRHAAMFMWARKQDGVKLDWWIERAKRHAIADGCKLFIVDPWNYFVKDNNRTLRTFKGFAEDYGVHVALIAHPRKPETFGKNTKMPSAHDIAGSGDFQRIADLIISLARDNELDGVTNGHVWKVRREPQLGRIGPFSMSLLPSGRYQYLSPAEVAEMRGNEDNVAEFSAYKRA